MKEKLAMAKKLFGKAKENLKSGGFSNEVPDNRYKAQVISAEGPVEAKTTGRLQAIIRFRILEGEYKDMEIAKFPNLEHEVGQAILLRELGIMGHEVEDFDEIEGALQEVDKEQPVVRITVKTKGEYQNISIDKVLDESAPAAEDTDASDPAPEDPTPEEPTAEPEPEPEPEAADDAGIVLQEGSKVQFTARGQKLFGPIEEIVDDETVRVKASDGKTYKLRVDQIEPYEEPKKTQPKVKKVIKK